VLSVVKTLDNSQKMGKYRILHLIDHLGPGGAQEVIRNLLKYPSNDKFEHEVAGLYGKGFYYDIYRDLGVQVYSLSPFKFLPLYCPHIYSLCRKKSYHIVHSHLAASNLIAKPLAAAAGIPVRFNHDHVSDPSRTSRKITSWLDRLSNRLSSHIIAVTPATRDFLVKYQGVDPVRVSVIINGVDLERFHPSPKNRHACRARWGVSDDAFVVCGAGRLRHQKNFSLFLKTAKKVAEEIPESEFVIAGSGSEEQKLKQQAADLELTNRVHFTGFVSDMTSLYPAADVFFLPSRYEGTPMVMLEVMAMGIPIVASNVDGVSEVLDHGIDACLAPPDSENQFFEHILRLWNDKRYAEGLAASAYEKVKSAYSAQTMARKIEDLYLRYLEPASP
jgi:glycosyltransferase involved in cell wall biosynthesis